NRLPHLADKLTAQIDKTALGAIKTLPWEYIEDINQIFEILRKQNISIAALEQSGKAVPLHTFQAPPKIALLLGNEASGVPKELLQNVDMHLEIAMHGKKESFNVVPAAAMALFQLRFH